MGVKWWVLLLARLYRKILLQLILLSFYTVCSILFYLFLFPRMKYSLSDFDFDLPDALIAQMPLPDRTASRLLHVDGEQLVDRHFSDVIDQLAAGDLLVFNDTRVLKARFFGVKETGGKVQLLVERVLSNTDDNRSVLVQMRASKSPLPGSKIRLADAFDVVVGERQGEFFTLFFPSDIFTLLETYGRLPLPPYIEHDADDFDEQRYQTVYNRVPGAVAAPTAGCILIRHYCNAARKKALVWRM
jgi:S-adenosylmethionine:tRNA ribosyltransferase-isomerase